MSEGYKTAEVARLAGVTLPQLQYWDERGIVKPKLSGRARLYTPEQLLEVRVVAGLKDRGLIGGSGGPWRLLALRVLRSLRRSLKRVPVVRRVPRLYLLTDGLKTYLETDVQRLLGRLKTARTGMVLLDLTELANAA